MREAARVQQRNNGSYTPFRTSGTLISSTVAAVCCLVVLLGAVGGWWFTKNMFDSWNTATATIVGVDQEDFGEDSYCPRIQFETATNQNITATLETSCEDNPQFVKVGTNVDIWYDPSDPMNVVDFDLPDLINVVLMSTIIGSALCSCCYVTIGYIFYKNAKSRDNNNTTSNGGQQTSYSFDNNSTPSSIPVTSHGGHHTRYSDPNGYNNTGRHTRYSDPNGYNNNVYASSAPMETTASAVFVSPNGPQPRSSAFSAASAYPESTPENTGLGAGEEAPPMVGCTLVADPNDPASQQNSRLSSGSQTYVSPNSLPLNPVAPTSSYVSPSDIHEARVTLDRQYR